jgi:prepilin-type N-terminal cleavage/methylation domain-containing protein
MTTNRPTAALVACRTRAGFTLIELLVVIAIIALIVGISSVAIFKLRESETNKATDHLMRKLQPGLVAEYQAVLAKAKEDRRKGAIPPAVLSYCDKDEDRAEAVWAAAHLKRHFPQTFDEALNPIPVVPGAASLPALATFRELAGATGTAEATPGPESAAILYLILSKKAAGDGFASDEATAGAQTDITVRGKQVRVYKDTWGNPVPYIRWTQNPEVNLAPYVNPNSKLIDPLDPKGLVFNWLAQATAGPPPILKRDVLNAAPYSLGFTNQNRLPSVFIVGKNGQFDSFSGDDRIGYHLNRLGNQGK